MTAGNGANIRVLQWLVGMALAIMVAAIPWAFVVQANIAAMREKLDNLEVPPAWFKNDVDSNSVQILNLLERVIRLELKGPPP